MILDSFNLSGKTALVTGASSGLGQAIAIALAEAGADVACHARSIRKADETCSAIESLGRRAITVAGDMADKETPARIVDETLKHFGHLDILINNAGTIARAPAVEYLDEAWSTVIEINLSSVFRLSQAAGRHMIEQGSGKIVNIASLLSFQGGITVPAYTASKSGVAGLTKALANEWAKSGVNVNAIAPGYMVTANTEALRADETRNRQILERIPAGRWGEPSDLAGAAIFLSSAASDYIHGHILVVDGGWMGR
ncbi:MAG TPA: 2-dehydro-3-deoxy-D-gluconate 5-dehydrogenase KduD [Pyrinomonadaceae bacterium]|jgi:2-dehydro-3-deoxy-D-gluconate 5-dehydrogenase|nr:2-dehydro-3-deoxy-D-gluconate 5-dehydrogenase KduD [Pyrinomonadaceae bacterium]